MSQLIAAAGPQIRIEANDRRVTPNWNRQDVECMPLDFGFVTPWWPRGALEMVGDAGDVSPLYSVWYDQPDTEAGRNTRYGVAGITRDVYNAPLGGCVVKMFRTSTDEMVSSTISDVTTGYFLASTPYYPDPHYLVAYKVGSPDVEGCSVNTLIGA